MKKKKEVKDFTLNYALVGGEELCKELKKMSELCKDAFKSFSSVVNQSKKIKKIKLRVKQETK